MTLSLRQFFSSPLALRQIWAPMLLPPASAPASNAAGLAAASKRAAQRFAERVNPSQTPPAVNQPTRCVLHFDLGVHKGAQLRLHQSPLKIGSAGDNDIVLRDSGVLKHHAELRHVDGCWALFVVGGGALFPALQTRQRGRCLRQRYSIGAASFVVSQAAWSGSVRANSNKTNNANPHARPWWQAAAATVLLVSGLALTTALIVQLTQPAQARVEAGTKNLSAYGWPLVQLVMDTSRGLSVQGLVDDEPALLRLRQWLREHGHQPALMQVRTGSDLVARVREALAHDTLRVQYQDGAVRISGTTQDLAVRTQVQQLRADLAAAVKIVDEVAYAEASLPPKQRPLPIRITSVLPGENGSFSTDAGARYFVGAVLSDGAEVVAIHADGVEFRLGEKTVVYPLK